jgi:hypothetical protein
MRPNNWAVFSISFALNRLHNGLDGDHLAMDVIECASRLGARGPCQTAASRQIDRAPVRG